MYGRNSVESHVKSKLFERNHQLDDLFDVRTLPMKQKVKKGGNPEDGEVLDERGRKTVMRTGGIILNNKNFYHLIKLKVVCNDPDQLVQTKIAEAGLDIHKAMVKVGLDDGQGMLKVCATVEELQDEPAEGSKKRRACYKDVRIRFRRYKAYKIFLVSGFCV